MMIMMMLITVSKNIRSFLVWHTFYITDKIYIEQPKWNSKIGTKVTKYTFRAVVSEIYFRDT